MAQNRYSHLAFSMLLSIQNAQSQPFARPPPYVQRSDGLVIVNDSSYSTTAVPPPYVQRSDGLVIVLDSSYTVIATQPPYIGWQQPLLNGQMQRPHVPTPFPQANPGPHRGSAASQHEHQTYIPRPSQHTNIPPQQRQASLHPVDNPPRRWRANIPPRQRRTSIHLVDNPPRRWHANIPPRQRRTSIHLVDNPPRRWHANIPPRQRRTSIHLVDNPPRRWHANIPPRQRRTSIHPFDNPPRRWHANIPPRQHRASIHPFGNPPPSQPSDEDTNGLMEGGNPPAAEHVIISLPSVVLSSDDEGEDCVICMAELDGQDRIIKLPCGHLFHINCVLSWLHIKNTCPLCRFELHADEIQVQA